MTTAFAFGALGRALAVAGHRCPVSAWLVAGSAVGLDNLSDAFFRLDCRTADPGCTETAAASSWHGQVHLIVGLISFPLIAPFALARRFRIAAAWR